MSDSQFVAVVIIIAASIVRYAKRLKPLSIKNGCCGRQAFFSVRDLPRQKKQLSTKCIIQKVFSFREVMEL